MGNLTEDLIRQRFGTIFKRGLVEYTRPTLRKRKKLYKLHKGHSKRPDWDKLDADKNMAIKLDSGAKEDELEFVDSEGDSQAEN